jgi:hypothetical protein
MRSASTGFSTRAGSRPARFGRRLPLRTRTWLSCRQARAAASLAKWSTTEGEISQESRSGSGIRPSERRGRDLNPRRTQKPETVFETVRKTLYAGSFALVRQFVRHDSTVFVYKADNSSTCPIETRHGRGVTITFRAQVSLRACSRRLLRTWPSQPEVSLLLCPALFKRLAYSCSLSFLARSTSGLSSGWWGGGESVSRTACCGLRRACGKARGSPIARSAASPAPRIFLLRTTDVRTLRGGAAAMPLPTALCRGAVRRGASAARWLGES